MDRVRNRLRFWCALAALACAGFSAHAQMSYLGEGAGGALLVSCAPPQVRLDTLPDRSVSVHMEDATRILEAGAPDLPRYSCALIVDDHAEMAVEVLRAEYEEIGPLTVLPSRGNLSRAVDPAMVPVVFGPQYEEDGFFPRDPAILGHPFIQRQYRGQALYFHPVQYNPVSGMLRVYTLIEAAVYPTDAPGRNPMPAVRPDRTDLLMAEVYAGRFLNYPVHADRYDQVGELGPMLVIAHPAYTEALGPWVQWKREKGIPMEVVDVTTVNSVAAIRSLIADRYQNDAISYVVLVGDEDQVPVELVSNSSGVGYCDACYGYLSGDDHYSEVFVGHFLVRTPAELNSLVSKILEYEKNPDQSVDWFSVAMGIASNEGSGAGDEDQADWQHQNGIKEILLDFTYTAVHERYDGNHQSASPTGGITADGTGNPSASSLSGVINSGCTLINYTGHGDHSLLVTGGFSNTHINQLDNHGRYPYFIAVGCCVGDYDDDAGSGDTFGETWIKSPSATSPTGGIGGAFSSVFQSWAPPMEGQDEMNELISGIGTFTTRHTLGSIHYHGCASMNDAYGSAGTDMADTWILMADPSVQLRTAFPTAIGAIHPDLLFFGETELAVASATEDAFVCLSRGAEILATGLVQNGNCSLSFAPLAGPGPLLLTLTSFNTLPYQADITLIPSEGPYVVCTSQTVNDNSGNANGLADYGETFALDIMLSNLGLEGSGSVTATLLCADPAIAITDDTVTTGSLDADESAVLPVAFTCEVAQDVEDMQEVWFTCVVSDGSGSEWQTSFPVVMHAPALQCTGSAGILELSGNGNGRPDSGETIQVVFHVANAGHATTWVPVSGAVDSASPWLSWTIDGFTGPSLAPGAYAEFVFEATVDPLSPVAAPYLLEMEALAGALSLQCSFEGVINQIVEDWESAGTDSFEWILSGAADWYVTPTDPYEGDYCLQSGDIGSGEQSVLTLELEGSGGGEIRFAYRVSSENGYDFLRFRVDGNLAGAWSGETGWNTFTFFLPPGDHQLRWSYDKDEIYSAGADAAWLDQVILPPGASLTVVDEEASRPSWNLYPNPASDAIHVSGVKLPAAVTDWQVWDASGRLVQKGRWDTPASPALPWMVQTQGWPAGLYTLVLQCGQERTSLRFALR